MSDTLMLFAGLILLFAGGEFLVKGAVALARNFGLSKLLVSAVIVGFGTSMPELTVSLGAALQGSADIAVGNVVGSNIANILLIVGLSALLSPIVIKRKAVVRDTYAMLGASLALCGLALWGHVGVVAGLVLFLSLLTYIFWSYRQDRNSGKDTIRHVEKDVGGKIKFGSPRAFLYSLVGLVLLIGGAHVFVEGAIALARDFNISEAVIGLTIVAVGTSLPEMVTALVAAYRGHNDVILGNILGSNIFNIFGILGLTAVISPVTIVPQIAVLDVWIMLAAAILFSIYLLRGWAINRLSGFAMIGSYVAYTAWLYSAG